MKLAAFLTLLCSLAIAADTPETVMITYQAKSGADAELARVIEKHWTTARQLKLVLEPHLILRGVEDDGRVYFVDIFTWRDEKVPDSAPAAIQAIWAEMSAAVETRGGKPGIQIQRVSIVAR